MKIVREEKRDRERIEILGELRGDVRICLPLRVTEISYGGCVIETAYPLHLDSLNDVRLTLGDRSIVLKGRVVHIQISDVDQEAVHYRSGIEFVEPTEHVRAEIESFISNIKATRIEIRD